MGTRAFPGTLRDASVNVETLVGNFASGTPDAEWIPQVAQHCWVVLTHDQRIRYNRLERDTVMNSVSRIIVICSGDTRAEMAEIFLASRNRILAFLRQNDAPFIARLYRTRVEVWLNTDNWMP